MQKITRKSSSGKFSLPTFARGKSRLDPGVSGSSATSSPAQGYPPVEDDEEGGMSASIGSLSGLGLKASASSERRESRDGGSGSQRGSRTWSSVLKLGRNKRVDGGPPSLAGSGVSVASDVEAEEEGTLSEDDEDTEGEEDEGGRRGGR